MSGAFEAQGRRRNLHHERPPLTSGAVTHLIDVYQKVDLGDSGRLRTVLAADVAPKCLGLIVGVVYLADTCGEHGDLLPQCEQVR